MDPPVDLRDRLAQLLIVRIGSNMSPVLTVEEDEHRIASLLDRHAIGGLCPLNGRGVDTAGALSRLQARSRFPLLVGTDMERGVGQQIRGGTVFPHAMAFGALGEKAESMVERYARLSAREALSHGIHVSFSPVADVNQVDDNPIIATRSFSTDHELVSKLVHAFVRGTKKEGLLSTAKHFPGHGRTRIDSHITTPVVEADRKTIEAVDLPPFRAAIDAGVPFIMSAHVVYPHLDPTGLPATLSSAILVDLLRGDMGFDGVVISDSLLMAGVRNLFPDEGELSIAALNAGVDLLLDIENPEVVLKTLEQAVADGRITESRVDQAFSRVWRMKTRICERFGSTEFFTDPGRYVPRPDRSVARSFAKQVAASALTVVGPESKARCKTTGIAGNGGVTVLVFKTATSVLDPPEQPIARALRDLSLDVSYEEIGLDYSEKEYRMLERKLHKAMRVLAVIIVKPAAWQSYGLSDRQAAVIESLTKQREVILASLGDKTVLEAFPEAALRLCTFSDEEPSQQALAEYYVHIRS